MLRFVCQDSCIAPFTVGVVCCMLYDVSCVALFVVCCLSCVDFCLFVVVVRFCS